MFNAQPTGKRVRKRDRQTDRQTDPTDRPTRQKDRQADRDRQRQIQRQGDSKRQREQRSQRDHDRTEAEREIRILLTYNQGSCVTTLLLLLLFVVCLTSQQHTSVSQGRICSDKFTCCHTEIEVADPTFYLTQSQNTDTRPTSPSADPISPGAWEGNHWSAIF